jgi:hypothetical protein
MALLLRGVLMTKVESFDLRYSYAPTEKKWSRILAPGEDVQCEWEELSEDGSRIVWWYIDVLPDGRAITWCDT